MIKYLLKHVRHKYDYYGDRPFREGFGNGDDKTFYVDIEIIEANSEKEAKQIGRYILRKNGWHGRFSGRFPTAFLEIVDDNYKL